MKSLKELLDERANKLSQARQILDTAEAEKRELSADEAKNYDELDSQIDALSAQIKSRNADSERRDRLKAREEELADSTPSRQTAPSNPAGGRDRLKETAEQAYERLRPDWNRYLSYGTVGPALQSLAVQSSPDTQGGFLQAPEQFVAELIKQLDDEVLMRKLCRVFPPIPHAKSLGAPSRTAKASTFAWGTELQAPTADSALKFGKRNLFPHAATGEILVSRDLLRSNLMSADQIVRDELMRDGGELYENGYLTGSGSEQPLGIFTASNDGISTGRDVATGSSTGFTGDGLQDALYSLKATYRRRAEWLFHRTAIKAIRKLKDGDGQYLWVPGLRAGEDDTLLGKKVNESEFAPSTLTTGLYVGMLASFKDGYWIVDSYDMEIQVLVEIAARNNQVSYLARQKTDGQPVLEEAFARLKTN